MSPKSTVAGLLLSPNLPGSERLINTTSDKMMIQEPVTTQGPRR